MFGVQKIGRYEVLGHLASGGMGQVYLARATGLGGFERQVVVKTLDLSITDDGNSFVTMFLDEARLVGALNHQYIAPVYEVGCDDEGRYYLVMDYINGETAEAVFRVCGERAQRLPLAFALTVVSCVASALDYAHNLCAADGQPLDIVHRDVSLTNVMCGHDGAVKLIDFGIAKAANRATRTQTGTLKGKIGYLAPEQILRQPVDHRADIFALGIVLYELTTGARAFRDNSDLVTLERITTGDMRPPSELVNDYPAELERIVMKALQLDPRARYRDAATMGRELEQLAARLSFPLGHAAIADVMSRLFAERRGRRRIARGSSDVSTGSGLVAVAPHVELGDDETAQRDERLARAQRPTLPIEGPRSQRVTLPIFEGAQRRTGRTGDRVPAQSVPLEDRPTPIAEPSAELRAALARIPLEDRPTPIGEPPLAALTAVPAIPATPPALPPPPTAPRAKIPTGPQLPAELDGDVDDAPTVLSATADDAPTVLSATLPERDDPTDLGETAVIPERALAAIVDLAPQPALASAPAMPQPMVRFYVPEHQQGTSVVSRTTAPGETPVRMWLALCGMFVLAVIVACVVALL